MKIFLIILSVIIGSFCSRAEAQTLEGFKHKLAQPAQSDSTIVAARQGARVLVSETDNAASAIAKATQRTKQNRFYGYRVCVFFDNGQNARAEAIAARDKCEEEFPDINAYMIYENPYFKVTVGDCLSSEEAIILMGRVLPSFPKAFYKKEILSTNDLLK